MKKDDLRMIFGIIISILISFIIGYLLIGKDKNVLVVPEKPVDYWKDSGLEINWYVKENKISHIKINDISDYIKEKEGFKSKAYRDGCLIKSNPCPNDQIRYSNGYGTIAKSKDEVITENIAEQRLIEHIKTTIYPIMKNINFKNEHQIFASIDFAYNIGHNAFINNIVNSNNEVDCAKMTNYIVFNGRVNEGLKKRRFENFIKCISIN